MATSVKRWYRSRKNQFTIFVILILLMFYYIAFHNSVDIERDLDVTRSFGYKKVILICKYESDSNNLPKIECHELDRDYTDEPPAFLTTGEGVEIMSSVIEYIEKKLQDALKEDKGAGCDVPKLDPFAKEVTQFDKTMPKIVCDGKDWVKCYLSKCRVVPEILATTKNIECIYSDIIYVNDLKYIVAPPTVVKGDQVYELVKSDHVKVTCTGKHIDSFFPTKWSGHSIGFRTEAKPKKPPEGREKTLNVLILGFDSTSKNGFIRRMPISYKVLQKELDAVILNGYNIVGDGTPAALFPILTGKTELELPEARKSIKNSGNLDSMPFIFYKLKDDGYRTAYFEDMPWIGTFQYRFNGFKAQPADHYLRDFYEEQGAAQRWGKGGNSRYCVGDIPQYLLMLNITDQFFDLDGKRFAFTFIADITHDDFNFISSSDEDVAEFLRNFKRQGRLKDTLLLVMGDHGPRYANVRETFQGKFEERLPLMAIVLPEDLKVDRPDALNNLKGNTDALTTPHDIHATLLDVLEMTQYWNPYKVKGADLTRGLTLLEPVPRNRSCSEAGIEPHWCACLRWDNVTSDDPMYSRVATALLDRINSITEGARAKCAVRTLTSVEWVMRQRANKPLLSFAGARDQDGYVGKFSGRPPPQVLTYQLKIIVGPGRGVYEGAVTYKVAEDKLYVNTREISRTNAYGNEPSCISDLLPHLNMYCYCNGNPHRHIPSGNV